MAKRKVSRSRVQCPAKPAQDTSRTIETHEPAPPKVKPRGTDGFDFVDDYESLYEGMSRATGTHDKDLAFELLAQASSTVPRHGSKVAKATNVTLAIMHGIQPRDELEGLLVTQMIAVHNMALECFQRAIMQDQTAYGLNENINRAVKLTRTFTAQMEALTRYRGKGEQKVTVEHVHVNEGGQAIVGNVHHQGGGGDGET